MNAQKLITVAKQMVAKGKGILAADESIKTIDKRFAPLGITNNEENRRAFRNMLLTAHDMEKYISGVILFDETVYQKTEAGKLFVVELLGKGILPGIKVDGGTIPMPSSPNEKLTTGLEGLSKRLLMYKELGLTFCKWRSVITIGENIPTDENIRQNTHDLATYAKLCQENDLVPMVEPEVLMDGNHTRDDAKKTSEKTLTYLFEELEKAGVLLEGLILKTSMVISGKESGQEDSPDIVGKETIALFKKVVPENLAGIVFLSGGQKEIQATENLQAMRQLGDLPWPVTFSYARALQDSATKTWAGKKENVLAAQKVFVHRAHMNSLASLGTYSKELEHE